MRLILIPAVLFCLIFALVVPMKMANDKFTDLLLQEKNISDSAAVLRYELSMLDKSIDSLSSRSRIDSVAKVLGLGAYSVPTKITEVQ